MNILILSREFPPYVLGGISYHLKHLYNEMAKMGHKITVLAGKCPQSWSELEGEIHKSIEVSPVQFGYRKGYYLLYPAALRAKLATFDTTGFDVAVAHTPLPFGIDDVPLVTKYHDCVAETRPYIRDGLSTFEKFGDSILHPLRTWADQTSLKESEYAIFNSNLNRNAWRKHYDMSADSLVSYNGVDTDQFYPCDSDRGYLLFVGASERKGLSEVLEFAKNSDRTIRIVGEVEARYDNVVVHGRVNQDKLRRLYSGAVGTIHPTKFEAFGNVILESLACGTPVITTEQCGAGEILTEEVGIISNSIQKGLNALTDTDSKKCIMIAEKFTWNNAAAKTEKMLRRVE